MFLYLLALGLLIGGIFLAVLLIGDRREARLDARHKAEQEQKLAAGEPVEGAWPPSPYALALPPALPERQKKPDLAPGSARNMVRKFSLYRNCVIGAVLTAFILYSCFPHWSFVWILLAVSAVAVLLLFVLTRRKSS